MAWKFESGVPIALQIVDRLRADILSGVYPAGEDFPTVRSLAALAGVNPNTMQKALSLLEAEGLLQTNGTAGRTVTTDADRITDARSATADRFVARIVSEARALGIPDGEFIEMIRRKQNNE